MNNKLKLIMLISITAVVSSIISGVITSMIVESENSNNTMESVEIIDAAFEEDDPSILLDQIKEHLSEINAEFGTVPMESTKLSIVTPEEEKYLLDAKKLIEDWDIPYFGMGIDYKVGSLVISFKTQQIADAYTPIIDQIINVPYYVEISDIIFEYDLCATQDIDCDVFLHG